MSDQLCAPHRCEALRDPNKGLKIARADVGVSPGMGVSVLVCGGMGFRCAGSLRPRARERDRTGEPIASGELRGCGIRERRGPTGKTISACTVASDCSNPAEFEANPHAHPQPRAATRITAAENLRRFTVLLAELRV